MIASLMGLEPAMQNDVFAALCLNKNSIYVQQMIPLIDSLQVNLTFENPVCDKHIAQDIFDWIVGKLPQLVEAESHATWCR